MDFIKDFKIFKEENSQVKITGEIPFSELEKKREAAIKHYGKNLEIDGFRKGHVPETEIVKRAGEMTILSEMAERALASIYPEITKVHNLEVIGYPQVQITKIAPDNPLGFSITVAVLPEITLPDYKSLAKEANKDKASAEVTDEEIDTQVKEILRQKLAYERLQSKAASKTEDNNKDLTEATELPTPETVDKKGETHTHADGTVHTGPDHDEPDVKAVTDDELPELTDEYVKSLGQPGQFESVTDFKNKIKEHLAIEKEREVEAAHRAKITDTIIDKAIIELPQVLIDSEIEQMFAQMNSDLERANLKLDDYLGHIKKTKDDLKAEWTPAAQKRAKLQLILNEIAKAEKVEPDKSLVDAQVDQLKEQYKDADETRVRIYVESILTNDAVMKLLEEQK